MADVQVTCVTRTAPKHDAITGIGAANGDWWWPVEDVIASIEAGTNTFFTMVGGRRADVRVVNDPTKQHIRTEAGGTPNDSLLALPACPRRRGSGLAADS